MTDIFGKDGGEERRESFTLADRMRPRNFDEFVGQEKLVASGKPFRAMVDSGDLSSFILWGPPGCGKTTLAQIVANETGYFFIHYSAVLAGIKEVKRAIVEAENALYREGRRTIVFIDEIHRFNKAQQDAFLSFVEKGTIVLIGATTENPSFEVISPLLSRMQLFVLEPLSKKDIITIMKRALEDTERGLGNLSLDVDPDVFDFVSELSGGDARFALNVLEFASKTTETGRIDVPLVKQILQRERLVYDKRGEEHYNLISALHKSLRDSDPDGALYWLARMLESGEDRLYIARRLVRFASEDVGNADPNALVLAVAAKDAFHFIGEPEGDLALAQLTIYLATAPKSNACYKALGAVIEDIRKGSNPPVPLHIRNAPTRLMKELGYDRGYKYAHDFNDAIVYQEHLPEELSGRRWYFPTDRGYEKRIKERLERWRKLLGQRGKK